MQPIHRLVGIAKACARLVLASSLVLVIAAPVQAARIVVQATNAGPIADAGRELDFDLTAINGPIVGAALEIDIDYSQLRELELSLVDASGSVILPLAAATSHSVTPSLRGRYRFTDSATTTWVQAEAQAAGGVLSNGYATRAFQRGLDGSLCLNLIGRYLEYDIDRTQMLRLRIARSANAQPGSGRIDGARLIIDTTRAEEIFGSGIEEPADPIPKCRRSSLDLVLNGGTEGSPDSTLTVLHYNGGQLSWFLRQRFPPFNAGPLPFGDSSSVPYAGRFGGRSRMNIGFWDPNTGALNFTTGAGARSLELPGDWTTTEHYPIPGDYDGDGVTDLAMAFLGQFGGEPRYIARVLFSSTDALRDFLVDPRAVSGTFFSSGQIGFGAAQDADLDGFDEVTQYARLSPASPLMSAVVWNVRPELAVAQGFSTAAWGLIGDIMVLGRWVDSPGPGNRLSQMVVRNTPTGLDWYLFGNPAPTRWGLPGDQPISINVDDDVRNDIAIYRPSEQAIYAIRSSDGQAVSFSAPGPGVGAAGFVFALGFVQGTIAPPAF